MPEAPTVAVGVCVLSADGQVLLVQRGRAPARGRWSVPGGKVDAGEGLAEAARREVLEETGLVVEPEALVTVIERQIEGFHYVIVDLLARVGQRSAPVAGDDAAAARWVSFAAAAALQHSDGLTEGLLPVLEQARRVAERLDAGDQAITRL